jgi:ABC-type branched-subunit amino acid transport system substrate-binding protein
VNGSGGIDGRKISIILKDDRYQPNPAVQNTNELIEKDKVLFLFDYVGTPTLTSPASVEVLREAKGWKRSAVHRDRPAAQATLRQIRV